MEDSGSSVSASKEVSDLEKTTKIIIGLVVVVGIVAVAIAVRGTDDYDYESQAKSEIDKYGYDAEIVSCDVQHGTNVFGVSLIKVSGTFTSGGISHTYEMTTYSDHSLMSLDIDDRSFWGDEMGNAAYNFALSEIGPFEYTMSSGNVYTEAPEDGFRFVLMKVVLKNVGHADGLSITAPSMLCSDGVVRDHDWSATNHHSNEYSDLSYSKLVQGSTVQFDLVFEIPEGVEPQGAHWDDFDLEMYGYVLDTTLEVA